jgi:hypothetical protein
MVRLQTLDLRIGVRVPASQPTPGFGVPGMRIAKLGLLLIPCVLAFGQDATVPSEKAPAAVDQALRARVSQFYQAFIDGKFRQAYLLVSEDSQDAFMESSKDQYKGCETVKIDFNDNFTKATVLESCMGMMHWHGTNLPTKVPLTSHWKLQNGDWDWYYILPTEVMTPWGKAIIRPEDQTPPTERPVIPDGKAMTSTLFTGVKLDKENVELHAWETSKDVVHVHNDMPGKLELQLDVPYQPGFKVHADKTLLNQGEVATITFEYKLDDAAILCGDCAKKVHGEMTVQLHLIPGRIRPIQVTFQLPPTVNNELPLEPPKPQKKKK